MSYSFHGWWVSGMPTLVVLVRGAGVEQLLLLLVLRRVAHGGRRAGAGVGAVGLRGARALGLRLLLHAAGRRVVADDGALGFGGLGRVAAAVGQGVVVDAQRELGVQRIQREAGGAHRQVERGVAAGGAGEDRGGSDFQGQSGQAAVGGLGHVSSPVVRSAGAVVHPSSNGWRTPGSKTLNPTVHQPSSEEKTREKIIKNLQLMVLLVPIYCQLIFQS